MTPDQHTISEFFLDVGDGHQLYVQDWGNKSAKTPVVFLHGGPGSQVKDNHKDTFDPLKQRVIFFDQRGCGKSLPYGSLENNTTQKLVSDIEKILDHLKISKVLVRGGSWGACLALAFALQHPDRVSSLLITGVFTGSQTEIDWMDQGRFKTFYPDAWETYLQTVPQKHSADPFRYHYSRVMGDHPQAAKESGHAYETMEGSIISLNDSHHTEPLDTYDPSGIRMEMHYVANGCFMPDRYILDNAHKLTMPVYMIQGRYDTVCPPEAAFELSKKLPDGHLYFTLSGHKAEHEDMNLFRVLTEQLTT